MSPTLLYGEDGTVMVMGTGGANRIRSALVQTITGLVDLKLDPENAVDFPRVHFEAGVLNAETFTRPGGGDFLKTLGANELVEFSERNMFFGGVHMVKLGAGGTLSGAGDKRRGGVLKVV
jgi:gamma-glutamyltranspeptidase/glutathione hydrolase